MTKQSDTKENLYVFTWERRMRKCLIVWERQQRNKWSTHGNTKCREEEIDDYIASGKKKQRNFNYDHFRIERNIFQIVDINPRSIIDFLVSSSVCLRFFLLSCHLMKRSFSLVAFFLLLNLKGNKTSLLLFFGPGYGMTNFWHLQAMLSRVAWLAVIWNKKENRYY